MLLTTQLLMAVVIVVAFGVLGECLFFVLFLMYFLIALIIFCPIVTCKLIKYYLKFR